MKKIISPFLKFGLQYVSEINTLDENSGVSNIKSNGVYFFIGKSDLTIDIASYFTYPSPTSPLNNILFFNAGYGNLNITNTITSTGFILKPSASVILIELLDNGNLDWDINNTNVLNGVYNLDNVLNNGNEAIDKTIILRDSSFNDLIFNPTSINFSTYNNLYQSSESIFNKNYVSINNNSIFNFSSPDTYTAPTNKVYGITYILDGHNFYYTIPPTTIVSIIKDNYLNICLNDLPVNLNCDILTSVSNPYPNGIKILNLGNNDVNIVSTSNNFTYISLKRMDYVRGNFVWNGVFWGFNVIEYKTGDSSVETYADSSLFPSVGNTNKLYLDLSNITIYAWDGSVYQNTLNQPTPNLQQVTSVNNITNLPIRLSNGSSNSIIKTNPLNENFGIGSSTNNYFAYLDKQLLSNDRSYMFPDKNGTFAMVSDLPSAQNLQNVTSVGNTTNLRIVANSFSVGNVTSTNIIDSSGFVKSSESFAIIKNINSVGSIPVVFRTTNVTLGVDYELPNQSGEIALLRHDFNNYGYYELGNLSILDNGVYHILYSEGINGNSTLVINGEEGLTFQQYKTVGTNFILNDGILTFGQLINTSIVNLSTNLLTQPRNIEFPNESGTLLTNLTGDTFIKYDGSSTLTYELLGDFNISANSNLRFIQSNLNFSKFLRFGDDDTILIRNVDFNTSDISSFEIFPQVINLSTDNGTHINRFQIGSNSVQFISSDINFVGITYDNDWSPNFTNESLITKRYVDNYIGNIISSYLSLSGGFMNNNASVTFPDTTFGGTNNDLFIGNNTIRFVKNTISPSRRLEITSDSIQVLNLSNSFNTNITPGNIDGIRTSLIISPNNVVNKEYVDGLINPTILYLNPVISILNTPPGSLVTGDRYLIDTSPTGIWVGLSNRIAEWNGSAWVYTIPVSNNSVFVTSTLLTYRFNGTTWVLYAGTPILHNGNSLSQNLIIGTNNTQDIIFKTNNFEQLRVLQLNNTVNYLTFRGSTSSNPVIISSEGANTNINISLRPKGTAGSTEIYGNSQFMINVSDSFYLRPISTAINQNSHAIRLLGFGSSLQSQQGYLFLDGNGSSEQALMIGLTSDSTDSQLQLYNQELVLAGSSFNRIRRPGSFEILGSDNLNLNSQNGSIVFSTINTSTTRMLISNSGVVNISNLAGATNRLVQADISGNLTASIDVSTLVTTSNAIVQNGNSFTNTMTIGTNDNFPLSIKTNGVERLNIGINGTISTKLNDTSNDGLFVENLNTSATGVRINLVSNTGGIPARLSLSTLNNAGISDFRVTDFNNGTLRLFTSSNGTHTLGGNLSSCLLNFTNTSTPNMQIGVNSNRKFYITDGTNVRLFVRNTNQIATDTVNYETLVTNDNDIPNRKFVTDLMLNQIIQGGNNFGSDINIGTNDNFGLNLETNGVTRFNINNLGKITHNYNPDSSQIGISIVSNSVTPGSTGIDFTSKNLSLVDITNRILVSPTSFNFRNVTDNTNWMSISEGDLNLGNITNATYSLFLNSTTQSVRLFTDTVRLFGIRAGNSLINQFTIRNTNVLGTDIVNYENLVINDNDIPNKKYVDSLSMGGSLVFTQNISLNFNTNNNFSSVTINNTNITNSNFKSLNYIWLVSTDHETYEDYLLEDVRLVINNIIDNVSFDVVGFSQNSTQGIYNFKIIINY